MMLKLSDNRPHLCLIAVKDISPNTELRYDYGDLKMFLPWRNNKKYEKPFNLATLKMKTSEDPFKAKTTKTVTAGEVLKGVLNSEGPYRQEDTIRSTAGENIFKLNPSVSPVAKKKLFKSIDSSAEMLQEPYLKIEDKSRAYRPQVYRNFAIPAFNFDDESKAVLFHAQGEERGIPNKCCDPVPKKYCKICDQSYSDLEKHLQTKKHVSQTQNPEKYTILDELSNQINAESDKKDFVDLRVKIIEGTSKFDRKLVKEIVCSALINGLMNGKTESRRHQSYCKGGKERRFLDDTDIVQFLDSNIVEIINEEIACSNILSKAPWDYRYKVILPELVVRIFSNALNVSNDKSEFIFKRFSSLLSKEEEEGESTLNAVTFKEMVQIGMSNWQKQIESILKEVESIKLCANATKKIENKNALNKDIEIVEMTLADIIDHIVAEEKDHHSAESVDFSVIRSNGGKQVESTVKEIDLRNSFAPSVKILLTAKKENKDALSSDLTIAEKTLADIIDHILGKEKKRDVPNDPSIDSVDVSAIRSRRKKSTIKTNPRTSLKCPVCNQERTNICHHLRETHGWSRQSASAASQFELKFRRKKKDNKSKNYHVKKICPIDNCLQVKTNMPEHLSTKHKI